MRKVRNIFIALFAVALVVVVVFFAVGYFKPKGAGLSIETTPNASVYINGEQVGRTPFEITREPGEIVVKLIPESVDTPLTPFDTKVELVSGIKTIIKRDFGETEDDSSGYILSFEKIGGKETSIAVISVPDAAQVTIDGSIRGFTPLKSSSIAPGEHNISVVAANYNEQSLTVSSVEGYKLTVIIKISPDGESQNEEEKPEEVPKVEEVEILDTPTGFLRVRDLPSTAGEEVGQVDPGEKYRYLETDGATGWFKIEYADGKEGWISNQYAKRVDTTEASPSPSPTN